MSFSTARSEGQFKYVSGSFYSIMATHWSPGDTQFLIPAA